MRELCQCGLAIFPHNCCLSRDLHLKLSSSHLLHLRYIESCVLHLLSALLVTLTSLSLFLCLFIVSLVFGYLEVGPSDFFYFLLDSSQCHSSEPLTLSKRIRSHKDALPLIFSFIIFYLTLSCTNNSFIHSFNNSINVN